MPRLTFGIALDFGSQLRPLHAQLERQSALLEAAETAGFEIVAAGESAAPGSFHLPNALLALAALTQRTRLRLCTGIALLPAWPVRKLALDAAELDQLSGGRLILGVGLGSAALQNRAGWPADAIGPTADETLEALRRLRTTSAWWEHRATSRRCSSGVGLDGDAVWAFSLNGTIDEVAAPPPVQTKTALSGPLVKLGDRIGAVTAVGGDKIFDGTVSTTDYAFAPVRISIPVGTTLTWQNDGAVIHTATDAARAWDTGEIPSGQSRTITFDAPGTFNYNCTPHPWMIGQITVQ